MTMYGPADGADQDDNAGQDDGFGLADGKGQYESVC